MTRNRLSAFTLVELLIVVSIIAILAGILFMGNIQSSFQRTRDVKRKQDLVKLAKTFEDYYNDNQHYPPNDQNTPNDPSNGFIDNTPWDSPWTDRIPQLPNDPLAPNREYFYQTNPYNQNFFALYAKLEDTNDPDIYNVGCRAGCGPNLAYNYVILSPNTVMYNGNPSLAADKYVAATGPTAAPTSPPGSGCSFNQCGFCQKCGGIADCGYLSRCWYIAPQWLCKFDVSCLYQ